MAKRAIQLTWVNPEEPTDGPVYRNRPRVQYGESRVETKTSVDIPELVKTTVKEVGVVVCWYILADTCRRIIVSRLGGK